MSAAPSGNKITRFFCTAQGQYNKISLGVDGCQRTAEVGGSIEIDAAAGPTMVTCLDLTAVGLFQNRASQSHPVNGFIRLSGNKHTVTSADGFLEERIPALFGASVAGEYLHYFSKIVTLDVNLIYAGCTLTGRISGRLPDDFYCAPGAELSLPILANTRGPDRFVPDLERAVPTNGWQSAIRDKDWRQQFQNPECVYRNCGDILFNIDPQ